jgi:molybdopterin converting factor small subunit
MLKVADQLNPLVAVDGEVVDEDRVLSDGACVAIIPPIAGG